MRPEEVHRSLAVVVVEAPLVAEVQPSVQIGIEAVERVSGRGRVVRQELWVVALVQIDAVEAGADAVTSTGMVLVNGPAEGNSYHKQRNQQSRSRGAVQQKKACCQDDDRGQQRAFGEVEPAEGNRKQHRLSPSGSAGLRSRAAAAKEQEGHRCRQEAIRIAFFD